MRRKRALISTAVAVAVIATGTAAAAANFGLLSTNNKQLPVGNLDLATVQANIHFIPAGGREVAAVPTSTKAVDEQPPTTTAVSPADTGGSTPVSAPHEDDDRREDHGSPDGYDDGHHDGHDDD
jgi:hypothetical protein